jgi:hypothetical protein
MIVDLNKLIALITVVDVSSTIPVRKDPIPTEKRCRYTYATVGGHSYGPEAIHKSTEDLPPQLDLTRA